MGRKIVFCVAAVLLVIAVSLGLHKDSSANGGAVADTQSVVHADVEKPYSAWTVDRDTDPVTGEVTVTAVDRLSRDEQLIVRLRGKKLECYVTTPDFLETMENMHDRESVVQFKIDNSKPVKQAWVLSDDNDTLFCPNDPRHFLRQLRTAKTFAFEYSPADKTPTALTFDVAGFPGDFDGVLRGKS